MERTSPERAIRALLASADVRIDGTRPWDIRVHRADFYPRILAGGSQALGEAYMDGWWDCDALDRFFDRILRSRLDRRVKRGPVGLWAGVKAVLTASPGRKRASRVGTFHYDIGNDLFEAMLDPWMNYSCAYWERARTLDRAQEDKMELICRKLALAPGLRMLDVGCGWGGLAVYAARRYGVRAVGITVSQAQVEWARRWTDGLPVTVEYRDYRDLKGTYDRILSVGMFEHVGAARYRTFLKTVHRCLAPNGLFLLHTIAGNRSVRSCDPWIRSYIFPHSMLPSARQIAAAGEGLFVLEDWHNFGADYDRTLMAWHRNVTGNWEGIRDAYDERFRRMWSYYLLSCAGAFRARRTQLWQIVFSKKGIRGGYRRVRSPWEWECPGRRPADADAPVLPERV